MGVVSTLQGMEMTKRNKAILMNAAVLVALAYFYFGKGTPPLILVISAVLCLVVLNVALAISHRRTSPRK